MVNTSILQRPKADVASGTTHAPMVSRKQLQIHCLLNSKNEKALLFAYTITNLSLSVVTVRNWTSLNLSDTQAVLLDISQLTSIWKYPCFKLVAGRLVDLIRTYGRRIDGQGPTLGHNVTTTGLSRRNWKEGAGMAVWAIM